MDQQHKERVALTSLFASLGLTIAKAIVGIMTGSLGILSEAGHSLIDFGATVMTFIAVRISGKHADDEHHYGHGKVEAISALAETALLFLLSAAVIFEAIRRLFFHEGVHVEATIWAFAVMIGSVVVDFFRARALSRTSAMFATARERSTRMTRATRPFLPNTGPAIAAPINSTATTRISNNNRSVNASDRVRAWIGRSGMKRAVGSGSASGRLRAMKCSATTTTAAAAAIPSADGMSQFIAALRRPSRAR